MAVRSRVEATAPVPARARPRPASDKTCRACRARVGAPFHGSKALARCRVASQVVAEAVPMTRQARAPAHDRRSRSRPAPPEELGTTMSCWVVPSVAAELWGCDLDAVERAIRDG